jgi:hypothetical protein
MPMIETNNVLSNPSGPEYQFLVGEGLYVLKEDLHLATPPPHPSEAPLVNPNPLATAPQPATAGTQLTLVNLDVNPLSPAVYRTTSRSDGAQGSIQENQDESQSSTDVRESSSDAGRMSSTEADPLARANTNTPAFGEGNTLLAPVAQKDPSKRRKPKNNMTKSPRLRFYATNREGKTFVFPSQYSYLHMRNSEYSSTYFLPYAHTFSVLFLVCP